MQHYQLLRLFGMMIGGYRSKLYDGISSYCINLHLWLTNHGSQCMMCVTTSIIVGSISVLMAFAAKQFLQMKVKEKEGGCETESSLSLLGVFKRISMIPSFAFLVAQGVFGAIPWDMMSFILLLLEWKDFTKEQIISFQVVGGVLGTIGALIGGVLGDRFAYIPHGRVSVALFSVISGVICYGLFLFSETYIVCVTWFGLFHLTGGWCPAAACRPLCADLAQNKSERAQIVAAWVLLEKLSSSIFGAPLVGYITKRLFDENSVFTNQEKARTLAMNMFLLSTFFWMMCALFFYMMGRAEYDRKTTTAANRQQELQQVGLLPPSLV